MFLLFLLLVSTVSAAGDQDFYNLKTALQDLFIRNPRMIPLSVRLAFHDLFHQKKVGGRGCIQNLDFLNLDGNAGLAHPVNILKQIVNGPQFQNSSFNFGDVVAFAGKIAVETAYPCIHIPFKYNREDCLEQAPIQDLPSQIPSGFQTDLQSIELNLVYLGLTMREFAILIAGAHGIKGSQSHAELSGFSATFSDFSSGKNYIGQTLNSKWDLITKGPVGAFLTRVGLQRLVRLPFEMFLYSSSTQVQESLNFTQRREIFELKNILNSYASNPRYVFDQAFAITFGKLMMISGGSQEHLERNGTLQTCYELGEVNAFLLTLKGS